jgi:Tfp pilus assembly protein PilE
MLSLLKKTGGDKAALQSIPWRPDFRDFSRLPDTKTVRTNFFVNLIAVVVTLAVVSYVANREWTVMSLRGNLAEVESQIETTRPNSERAQAAFAQFQAEEKKFNEAFALVRDPFRFSSFLVRLGEIMPPGVSVRRVDFRGPGQTISMVGIVPGLDAAASDVASNFVRLLQNDPELSKHFESVSLTNLGRNADEASLNLELVLTFKKPAATK